jgi:hypothetical protein
LSWINTLPGQGLLPSGATANGNCWHKARAQPGALEGTETAALPTLGTKCLVSGGKPTVFKKALKVGK